MEKDPDEATVISTGSGRGFSGDKEHLVPSGPGHQGEWHLIWHADGHAATGRRRSGWLSSLGRAQVQQPVLIWPGELPCPHPQARAGVVQPHGSWSTRSCHPRWTASSPSNPDAPQPASRIVANGFPTRSSRNKW